MKRDFVSHDATSSVFGRPPVCVCVIRAVSDRLKEVTASPPFREARCRDREDIFEEFPGQSDFSKARFFSLSNGHCRPVVFLPNTMRLSLGRQTRAKRRARRHHTSCHASDRRPSFPEALVRPFSGPRARAAARVGAAAPRPRTSAGVQRRRRRASRAPPPCPGPRRGTRRTRKAGCPGRGSCGNSTTP